MEKVCDAIDSSASSLKLRLALVVASRPEMDPDRAASVDAVDHHQLAGKCDRYKTMRSDG